MIWTIYFLTTIQPFLVPIIYQGVFFLKNVHDENNNCTFAWFKLLFEKASFISFVQLESLKKPNKFICGNWPFIKECSLAFIFKWRRVVYSLLLLKWISYLFRMLFKRILTILPGRETYKVIFINICLRNWKIKKI